MLHGGGLRIGWGIAKWILGAGIIVALAVGSGVVNQHEADNIAINGGQQVGHGSWDVVTFIKGAAQTFGADMHNKGTGAPTGGTNATQRSSGVQPVPKAAPRSVHP